MSTSLRRTHSEIAEPVFAAIAARAAIAVPGVARLEPGLLGLIGSATRSARGWIKGLTPASVDGVRVSVEPELVRIEVSIVLSGLDQAAAVGGAVQRAVGRAVAAATGYESIEVSVSVLDIEW
ncbi:Asp23/Gls24 family envelope stress response protein [Kutzneria sp. NPDC052558]|uniref:Asp23/Gls24 family envelope stress response protein n=1 Tax=Kutzneria sp. NPDC052558 TaxID=3364121 RepID=UPI0037CAEA66